MFLHSNFINISVIALLITSCDSKQGAVTLNPDFYNVAFLITDGTYNTELTAPYDIFQHTRYRDGIKAMNVFTVSNTSDYITTFEGLKIKPNYNLLKDPLPKIDILVIPSAEHHLDTDMENKDLINFIKKVDKEAIYVTSHCDGAFMLAKSGILDGKVSTTFPSDISKYKSMFPLLQVKDSVHVVHDGKYITSAGGARSFDAAMYLTHILYGDSITKSLGRGLVIDWDIDKLSKYVK
jgi:transcriptional regulator GlxA family with amidase domain